MLRLPSFQTLIFFAVGVAAASGIFFLLYVGSLPELAPSTPLPSSSPRGATIPHVAGGERVTLTEIAVEVFYFAPRDRASLLKPDWQRQAESALQLMRAFHRLQFRGLSELSFTIHQDPVIGEQDGAWYDSENTARGNPHAWETIGSELDRRQGKLASDIPPFRVRLVLYAGVGALGGEHQILVSDGYLQTPYAASTFYHELGHTFGLQDAYEYEHGAPLDEDIMGLGRQKPIGQAYLSEKAKKELGIAE